MLHSLHSALSSMPAPLSDRKTFRWHPRAYPPPPISSNHDYSSRVNYKVGGFGIQIKRRLPGTLENMVDPYPLLAVQLDRPGSFKTATHRPDGYVEVGDGEAYSLTLSNSHGSDCDATVKIDGEEIGTFRIRRYSQITLEGPPNDGRRFTFYKAGTVRGVGAGIEEGRPTNGVIEVSFIPGYSYHSFDYSLTNGDGMGMMMAQAKAQAKNEGAYGASSFAKGFSFGASRSSKQSSKKEFEGATGLAGHTSQSFRSVEELDLDHSRKTVISCRLIGVAEKSPTKEPVGTLEPAWTSFLW